MKVSRKPPWGFSRIVAFKVWNSCFSIIRIKWWGLSRNFHWQATLYTFFYLRFWTSKIFEKFCKNLRFTSKIYFIYLFRPWKPCGASKSNGPRSKGQKSSHPMPWTAFGKSWTIKTFIMNQTSLISKQNLWISRMIWHHRKGNFSFSSSR